MKYKVGDIVRVKPVEYFTDVAIQREGTMSLDESFECENKKSPGFYFTCWSAANPNNPELDADFDFHFTQLPYCNKEAIILDVVEDKIDYGERVVAELEGDLILNPTTTYYILSIGTSKNMEKFIFGKFEVLIWEFEYNMDRINEIYT